MRLLYCLLLLVLSSCTTVSFPEALIPADQRLFAQGMEQLETKSDPTAFAVLQQNHPDSPWAQRACTVQQLLQTIAEQQQRLDGLQREHKKCRQQDEILRQQNEALEGDLQRLKQLLIDFESRRK